MMVVRDREVSLAGWGQITVSVDVACINMRQAVPGRSNAMAVSGSVSGNLERLVRTPGFRDAPFRARQFAVWTITDNPSRSDYTGIGFGVGSGPSERELHAVHSLLSAADIDPQKYRAFIGWDPRWTPIVGQGIEGLRELIGKSKYWNGKSEEEREAYVQSVVARGVRYVEFEVTIREFYEQTAVRNNLTDADAIEAEIKDVIRIQGPK